MKRFLLVVCLWGGISTTRCSQQEIAEDGPLLDPKLNGNSFLTIEDLKGLNSGQLENLRIKTDIIKNMRKITRLENEAYFQNPCSACTIL